MIRRCNRKDTERMYYIINEAAKAYDGVIPADRYHQPYMPMDELKSEMDRMEFLGWEEDSKLVGVMGLEPVKDVTLIRHAYVLPEWQSKGIGGKLLVSLKKMVKTRSLLVGTWADSFWAIGFYKKHGFKLRPDKDKLLKKYWDIPERQIETSVVLSYDMEDNMTEEKRFEETSAKALTKEIIEFARTSPLNLMPGVENMRIFDKPVVRFADGDDRFFTELKTIIAPAHMTPREILAQAYKKTPDMLPSRISVISWILPITEETRKSNGAETAVPSRFWSHTRWFGEKFNDALREYVTDILTEMGYLAVAPASPPYLKMVSGEKGMYSNWSERHIAYAAGQGTFGLSDGFITEKGIAHRCGSVVTDLALPPSPRTAEGPYANCLYHFSGACKKCAARCPAGAISENGHDKMKCLDYARSIGYSAVLAKNTYDLQTSVAGCGLCQTGVPCERRIPLRIQRNRKEKSGQ